MAQDAYHLSAEGFFSENYSIFRKRKNLRLYGEESVQIPSEFPLLPFMSAREGQLSVKAPLAMLVTDIGAIVNSASMVVKNITLGLINILVWDVESVDDYFVKAFIDIMGLLYFAANAIIDSSYACLLLITQSCISIYDAIVRNEWEITPNLDDDTEVRGYSEGFLAQSYSDIEAANLEMDGLSKYEELKHLGYFQPFSADVQTHLKAPLMLPISYLGLSAIMTVEIVKHLTLAVVNTLVLDFSQAWVDLKLAWRNIEINLYSLAKGTYETLNSILLLTTRTMATTYAAIELSLEPNEQPHQQSLLLT